MDRDNTVSIDTDMPHPKTEIAPPCTLVIFGIAGDLTKRLLFPALCNLGSAGLLDENFCIIGVAKEDFTEESFRQQLIKNIETFVTDPASLTYGMQLANRVHYISGDFNDANVFVSLKNKLSELTKTTASPNCLFYFAVPPSFIETIATQLHDADLLSENDGQYFRRIVVEKPFGNDLASAKKLNRLLLSMMEEKQIFRIDHFLGKETVQNLLVFRFSNGLFEPIWNRLYVDHVQITVAETLGVESRGNYYEHAGALRDMVPNHLFQMLSLITMEPPSSFSSENIRAEKTKALHAIQTLSPQQVLAQTVRGQYGPGKVDSKSVRGYRSEPNVASDSSVETYVALKLFVDNWRWLHVPFYLRTGKHLAVHQSEILIKFKSGPAALFNGAGHKIMHNVLRVCVQPDEGISLRFNTKVPGQTLEVGQVNMTFKYKDYFGLKPQTGYETILYECMDGDHLLFNDAEMVETSWALVQPIMDVWSAIPPRDFPNYAAGSDGPKAADDLLHKDGRKWFL